MKIIIITTKNSNNNWTHILFIFLYAEQGHKNNVLYNIS